MPSIFDYVPWQLMAGGGVGLVLLIGVAVWYYTGSLKAAITAAVSLGAVLLLAIAKKKGRQEGIQAERQLQTKRTIQNVEQKVKTDEAIRRMPPDDRRKRLRAWSRDR